MLLGAHVSSAGGIASALDRAKSLRCDAIQVFTQSPRMWRPTAHAEEELARFRERRADAGVKSVVCHAVYLVNLATPDRELRKKSMTTMQATLETARAIEAEGVVFHVGSHVGSGFAAAKKRVVPQLRRLLELTTDRTWLLMENCAGTGGTIGRSIDELETLLDALDGHPRLGICLDSCHWYASGVDVTDRKALNVAVAEVDQRIGLERVRALHVNDSAAPLGSNRDRHANVGEGLMKDGLGVFLAHRSFRRLPALLETPGPDGHGPDATQVRRLRALYERATNRS